MLCYQLCPWKTRSLRSIVSGHSHYTFAMVALISTPIPASIREIPSGPLAFGILVSVDDRLEFTTKKNIGVAVKSNQTLTSFKEDLLTHHGLVLTDLTLILIGRELKDDAQTLEELGFIPGCTVHAGKYSFRCGCGHPMDLDFSCEGTILRVDSNVG
jgi:Ubiquitin family